MELAELEICTCCGWSPLHVIDCLSGLKGRVLESRMRYDLSKIGANPKYVDGIINLLCSNNPASLNEKGREIFDLLVAYLVVRDNDLDPHLWGFIKGYFDLHENCGYDYLLLCYLDTHKVTEHGIAIRYVWFRYNYSPATSSEEHKKICTDWLQERRRLGVE